MRIIAVVLALQTAVLSAPSENPREINTDAQEQILNEDQNTDSSKHIHRHKRCNYYGYGFPPLSPIIYPTNKRDDAQHTDNHGANQDESFTQIYTRLQEIVQYARQPGYASTPPFQIPIFFPVIFVPQTGCGCTPTQEVAPASTTDATTFELENRFPKLNDSRQNWGFVVTNNDSDPNDIDYVDDSIRPVNFAPVTSKTPTSRPPPPVEHGSSQAGISPEPVNQERGSSSPPPPSTTINPFDINTVIPPTPCEYAILSCCHQAQPSFECFVSQGCQRPVELVEYCSVETIRLVLDRFQRYYGQVNGR